MSISLNFTPHSWYMGAAIEKQYQVNRNGKFLRVQWFGYIEDGMYTYSVIELDANTLKDLKQQIKAWHERRRERDLRNRRMIGENI